MSLIWFIILLLAYGNGVKIDDFAMCMVAIFYIEDCVLMKK